LACVAVVGIAMSAAVAGGRSDQGTEARQILMNSIGMEFIEIPAGEFLMGAPSTEDGARDDETPQHQIKITKPFRLGKFEVTQQEYERVMGRNPSFFSATGKGKEKVAGMDTKRFPVEQVSWDEAVEFCRKLSELPAEKSARRAYRLPTEAEWQYACRAGTTTAFHFGNSLGADQANINGHFPYPQGAPRGKFLNRTAAVGSYSPNAFGLYDMHGNVAEYCHDWFGREYYRESPPEDPQGPSAGADKLVMGGSWSSDAARCRCAFRRSNATSGRASYFGLRVVCDR